MNFSIDKMKNRLLVKYSFFGRIVANTTFVEDLNIKTAATDGEKVYYNPSFVETLGEDKQTFLFAHEICHIAFDHISKSEGKDPKTWNIATDAVINDFLQNDHLEIIDGAVNILNASDYNAEDLYEKLIEEKKTKKDSETSDSNDQNNENNRSKEKSSPQGSASSSQSSQDNNKFDVGHDTHSMWPDAIKNKKKESQSKNETENQLQNDEKKNIFDKIFKRKKRTKKGNDKSQDDAINSSNNGRKTDMEQAIEEISKMGEKNAFEQNSIFRQKKLDELKEKLARECAMYGNLTNSENRHVGNIGTPLSLINWKRLLKDAIKIDIDWTYQNANIEDGIVNPGLEDITISETEILLDTSGSIKETLLRNFLRECKNILKTSKLKVGCFDTEFYGFEEIRSEKDIENMKFKGGGGTNFDIAVNAFSKRVTNRIIFTDGYADMPQNKVDAIWVVFGNNKINPKGGKVINISQDQLQKLSLASDYINYETKRKSR